MTCLTSDRARELFHYDAETGAFTWRATGNPAFTSRTAKGYAVGNADRKKHYAHRVAWLITMGKWPEGQIDHINGNREDNRLSNLRDIPRAENQRNMKRSVRNSSGVVGVHYTKTLNKWQATIRANGKSKYLGVFRTKEEAAAARAKAELVYGFHANHGRG